MGKNLPKWLLYSALFALYLLHNDLWLRSDASLMFGIPIGLLYHIAFCIAAFFLFILIIKNIWPAHLEVQKKEEMQQ